MKVITLACLLIAAAVQAAQVKVARYLGPVDPVQEYWDHEAWGGGSRFYGNMEFSAKDMDILSEKIQKTLAAAGAKLTNVNTYKPEPAQVQQRQRARRSFTFRVPAEHAEEVAAKLSALAPLESYNFNAQQNGLSSDPAKEIQERINSLNVEMEQNREVLKSMPIARALCDAKLSRLKRAQASLGDDAQLNVSVTQADVGNPGTQH
ncbi:MAG: hypothetical protein WC881_07825 [Elusimicrobiota bacterium]|jgi:hypothetical protein